MALTSEELRAMSHFQLLRVNEDDVRHLSPEDTAYLSDQKTEAKGRFMDYDDFVGEADNERAA